MLRIGLASLAFILTSGPGNPPANQPHTVIGSCTTRTVNAQYSGSGWQAQHVCQENEIAISGDGFCSQAGAMIGASTTQGRADRDVWLWCSKPGAAIWYGNCCEAQQATPPPKALHDCVTRTVKDQFSGGNWVGKQVCNEGEVAVSGGGFCSKAGQMVGASTTKGNPDRQVWLQCSGSGDAIWYGMCCQQ